MTKSERPAPEEGVEETREESTQVTERGTEMPVPTREQVERDLRKAMLPEQPSRSPQDDD